jgi:hypothetical protein
MHTGQYQDIKIANKSIEECHHLGCDVSQSVSQPASKLFNLMVSQGFDNAYIRFTNDGRNV